MSLLVVEIRIVTTCCSQEYEFKFLALGIILVSLRNNVDYNLQKKLSY